MALNLEEGSSAGMELVPRFWEFVLSDEVDEFQFGGLRCGRQELYDNEGGKFKMGSDEIADLLPSDPFNMEEGARLAAMTGRLEEFKKEIGLSTLGFKGDKYEIEKLDVALTGKMKIHQDAIANDQGGVNDHFDKNGGNPSDALLLALCYLGSLGDLFAVEGVCKSLRDTVRGDPLLWKNIDISHPFCTKITDDILIKLTNRAQGHLHSLSLFHCSKITDAGLKHVLDRNPHLSKLNVPGCSRLTADGILSNLKIWKTIGKTRLTYLGVYGLTGITNQHMEEFKLLTGVDNSKLPTTRKPRFFGCGQRRLPYDDDRAIDIEICPKCQKFELVYDCTSESCQKKQPATQLCRACTTCIMRCFDCGCCLINCDYVELFSLDLLCLDCRRRPYSRQEGEQKTTALSEKTVLLNGVSYHFYPSLF